MKSRKGKGVLNFWGCIECLPDKPRTLIFSHQHRDSLVDADYVRVVPVRQWIEGIHKSVTLPHQRTVRAANIAQHSDAIREDKRKRADRGAWNDGAINRTLRRRTAPGGIATAIVRSRDTPEIVAVVGELGF